MTHNADKVINQIAEYLTTLTAPFNLEVTATRLPHPRKLEYQIYLSSTVDVSLEPHLIGIAKFHLIPTINLRSDYRRPGLTNITINLNDPISPMMGMVINQYINSMVEDL